MLRRSHEREEKDEKELEEEARDVVDTLVEGAGVFLKRTKHFCIFANQFHPAEQIEDRTHDFRAVITALLPTEPTSHIYVYSKIS